MNIVIIISIIILCIYLVIVYREYTKKDAKKNKNELTDMCSKDQCDDCPYKNFCYLYDEDIEKEED